MGNRTSTSFNESDLQPVRDVTATLYYFKGRGLADQIRWILAATNVTFTQKVVTTREQFLLLAEHALPYKQLPLLQIDGLNLVQSRAIFRYIAKRQQIDGSTSTESVKIDMVCETVNDFLPLLLRLPFVRAADDPESLADFMETVKMKWNSVGAVLERQLKTNKHGVFVGSEISAADITVAHCATWLVEECGPSLLEEMPCITDLQNRIIELPGIRAFIRSELYYPVGDKVYVEDVQRILGRNIK